MTPDTGRAGEDHMVEGELRESDADLGVAGEHRHFALVEIIGNEPRHQRRYIFGKLARLDHRAVARGEDARHRDEDHADGKIPRRDDPDDALGLIDDLGFGAEQSERKGGFALLALRPARHVLFRMLERADRRHDIGHQRLVAATMPEILAHYLGEFLGMVDEQRDRTVYTVSAHRKAFGHGCGEARPLRSKHLVHARRFAG